MILRTLLIALAIVSPALAAERPLIIDHSGAYGYLPEHTLEGYELAIRQGADYMEIDLAVTKDGVLIARFNDDLAITTDIDKKFPARKATKTINGKEVTGWFPEDFTLAELKTLRVKQRETFRDHSKDGKYQIPTFAEILELRARLAKETGRFVGVYPEPKQPAYYRSIGLPVEERLAEDLKKAGLNAAGSPVLFQDFDADSLKRLKALSPVPRILLLGATPPTDDELKEIATYAQGIGPWYKMITPVGSDNNAGPPTDIVTRAHKFGLVIHPWAIKPESPFLPNNYGGDISRQYCQLANLGVDGIFTDTPDLAAKAFRESCPMSARTHPY